MAITNPYTRLAIAVLALLLWGAGFWARSAGRDDLFLLPVGAFVALSLLILWLSRGREQRGYFLIGCLLLASSIGLLVWTYIQL